MIVFLPFLLSVVVFTTAIRSETGGKGSLSAEGLRSGREVRVLDAEGKSRDDHQGERENGILVEVLENRGDGISNGGWVISNAPSHDGIKPSATSTVNSSAETDHSSNDSVQRKDFRKLGEDGKGINRLRSVGWSKSKSTQGAEETASSSRTRRDLHTLKRMLDDSSVVSANSDELPEEEEPPEMNGEEPEMYEGNEEVPRIGDSRSGDASRRQDFSKRPKYYPDWGPKRTWRINMMRVWGKRYLSGYDKKHALRNK